MLLALVQAAKRLGVAPATLRAQVHRQKLRATKLGRDWLVEEEEVERYRRSALRRGHCMSQPLVTAGGDQRLLLFQHGGSSVVSAGIGHSSIRRGAGR